MIVLGLLLLPQRTHSWVVWAVCTVLFGVVDTAVLTGVNILFEPAEFKQFVGRVKEMFGRRSSKA